MSAKPRNNKQAASSETSDTIAEQTQTFLKSGGKIDQIKKGVSSQNFRPGKQISLGKK